MSVAVAVSSIVAADPGAGLDRTRTKQIVYGTLTLSGNYGTGSSHGDTINFALPQVISDLAPTWVNIEENQGAGNAALLYTFKYMYGTTQSNGQLLIAQSGTEITEGNAYSSFTPSLNNVVLRFRAEFPGQV